MKENKKYLKWLDDMWEKWSPILMLQKHTMLFIKDNSRFYSCEVRYPYLNSRVTYSDESFKLWKQDKKISEEYVVHEFCHLITDPLYVKSLQRFVSKNEIEDERELLTDHIQRIVTNNIKV